MREIKIVDQTLRDAHQSLWASRMTTGAAQPATQTIVRNLRSMGYEVNVDDALIDEVGEHFRKVAEQEGQLAAGPIKTGYTLEQPLVRLLSEIAKRPKFARVFIQKQDMQMEFRNKPRKAPV